MSRYPHKPAAGLKSYEYAATLEEIARTLGVSKERVHQIEIEALAKARAILTKHGFTLQDLLPDGDHHG